MCVWVYFSIQKANLIRNESFIKQSDRNILSDLSYAWSICNLQPPFPLPSSLTQEIEVVVYSRSLLYTPPIILSEY